MSIKYKLSLAFLVIAFVTASSTTLFSILYFSRILTTEAQNSVDYLAESVAQDNVLQALVVLNIQNKINSYLEELVQTKRLHHIVITDTSGNELGKAGNTAEPSGFVEATYPIKKTSKYKLSMSGYEHDVIVGNLTIGLSTARYDQITTEAVLNLLMIMLLCILGALGINYILSYNIIKLEVKAEEANRNLIEKNSELEAFAHTVAHDLKNPINAIIGFAELGLEEIEDIAETDPRREILNKSFEIIIKSSKKSVEIIHSLLLLATVEKQNIQRNIINMHDVLKSVENRLAPMIAQFHGRLLMPEQFPLVLGYADWIEEIWMNYLTNGLKYGGQPPVLEIGATLLEGNFVEFWVQDNGHGMSPEETAKLFRQFSRLERDRQRNEGHGLGLSIVRRITDKLGGHAGVTSRQGEGSRFYFTLPLATK
ncbi:signal transduction histidine kinase [Beggiatoa alba B18LD]|uniref:histidine kinase n=1 Tax=Beggiatoa alba B18LD TaxID=395493 RepID=I3CDH3_9GAMM|nr:HAMP domain-containing sensor histidine kinase [Beggiatoa alba]EIJ41666.1 signal transduction histidine kinase [Beggiatoa alba B18LD]